MAEVQTVALVSDSRSPIARAWRDGLVETNAARVVWEGYRREGKEPSVSRGYLRRLSPAGRLRRVASAVPHVAGRSALVRGMRLLGLPLATARLRSALETAMPDLVHALRIPFEGITAAMALGKAKTPFIVSVWGNDFTYHARESAVVRRLTRTVMLRANGLHSDCYRDQELAREFGWQASKPTLVVPGSGGIDAAVFWRRGGDAASQEWECEWGPGPFILNPRGIRAYVDTEAFLAAVPLVLCRFPTASFLLPGTKGHPEAERLRRACSRPDAVHLLPAMPPKGMAELFRRAPVFVSASRHDGTPNTLLEGMACGSYPIVGNIESVREWIADGRNGAVLRELRGETIAKAIVQALDDRDGRRLAADRNADIIGERAERQSCMKRVHEFYNEVVGRARHDPRGGAAGQLWSECVRG